MKGGLRMKKVKFNDLKVGSYYTEKHYGEVQIGKKLEIWDEQWIGFKCKGQDYLTEHPFSEALEFYKIKKVIINLNNFKEGETK